MKKDTWQSWMVSLVLTFLVIKFVFFPLMSFAFNSELPLVVVESCSMYHEVGFDKWWEQNGPWYDDTDINKGNFEVFPFKNGLNKGDIVLVSGRGQYKVGDVIIFSSVYTYPLIHRVVSDNPLATKGDHNGGQLAEELNINKDAVIGHAVARVPGLGWLKLIFFEGFKSSEQRGFCR